MGTGFLSEFSASFSDFLGTTNGSFKNKLAQAKELALKEMVNNAKDVDANAILGISYNVITTNNNMFIVTATGTAVKLLEEA